ncbi:MAG: AAA family ATPase [Clostridiales bacterium]|nr:AAA family ATPase [Clostridiales bacterium]
MGKTVAVFNQKGGVGKTTTCINLAAALGKKKKKVLLADLDPQGNTTSGVGIDKASLKASVYDVLINKKPVKDAVIKTQFKNLDILPADMNLAGAELELAELSDRFAVLKKAVAPLISEYDYIFIDCPPSLGLLSLNSLTAADTVLVPLQCEYFALEGLSQLLITVRSVKQHHNEHLELEGVVPTMFTNRQKLCQQVLEEIQKYFSAKTYKTVIPRSVKIAEAPSYGMPVVYYEKYSKVSLAYKKLADEFLGRQGN